MQGFVQMCKWYSLFCKLACLYANKCPCIANKCPSILCKEVYLLARFTVLCILRFTSKNLHPCCWAVVNVFVDGSLGQATQWGLSTKAPQPLKFVVVHFIWQIIKGEALNLPIFWYGMNVCSCVQSLIWKHTQGACDLCIFTGVPWCR